MIDTSFSIETLNISSYRTLSATIGIEFTEVNENYLKAKMPIDDRTRQQLGLLHGGASAALAEMCGSVAAYLSIDRTNFYCVGQELKINHIKPAREGFVYATAKPLHLGFSSHVWEVRIEDENGELVAFSTLTMAVIALDKNTRQVVGNLLGKISG